jgi:hypothetical protein
VILGTGVRIVVIGLHIIMTLMMASLTMGNFAMSAKEKKKQGIVNK